MDVFEEAARFDLGRVVRGLIRCGWWPFPLVALPDGVVDLLDVGEEGIEVGREGVQGAPERQVSAWAQQSVRLAIANRRIDPMPRGRRVDDVEGLRLVLDRKSTRLNSS